MIQRWLLITGLLGVLLTPQSYAASTLNLQPASMRTECVGRYEVTVPGKVEVAVQSVQHWFSEVLSDAYRFSDDSVAPFSTGPDITNTLSLQQFSDIQSKTFARFQNTIQELKNARNFEIANSLKVFPIPTVHGFAFQNNNGISVTMYFNSRIHTFAADNKQEVLNTLNSLHPRALYEIPTQPGVCSPYVFFLDDGNKTRNVGVTMRLIDHPDVEIFFQDSSYPFGYEVKTNNPETQLNAFWDNVGRIRDSIKYIDMDWHRYRDVNIAGIHGKGTFVTITNKDESKDYGYCAYAISTPEINVIADNKRVYVIRTAARAKAKGIEPVSKDDIKAIAESVMASIKRHPVSPGN